MKKFMMTLTYGRACSRSTKRTSSFGARLIAALAAVLCCWVTLYAQQLTEQQAMERALQYMNSGKSSANARGMAAPALKGSKALTPAATEATKIYAFNMDGGGYVIASGDQRTLPVLGYSTTGSIDWEQMPENMRSWLKQYDKAIATLGDRTYFRDGEQTTTLSYDQGAIATQPSRRAERVAVEPLVKTHWYQDEPYWNQVPKYQGADPSLQGKQCYTGCAATAMAQVMNYWQWPKTMPDGLPAYDYETKYNGITKTWHISALPPTWFDWNNMADDYGYYDPEGKFIRLETTETQDKAVATLMRYCGQSVQMMYGPRELGGSGTHDNKIAKAFTNYFDYNAAQFIQHKYIPDIDEWEEIIYGELAAGRPIVYLGQSDAGGHAFVCDGYDGEGMFHINWGWSGLNDGYFALAVLNPYNNTSAGSGIGFCINEEAVIYTDPKMEPQPVLHYDFGSSFYQYIPIRLFKDNVAVLYYSFFETYNDVADHALGTIDEDGTLHPLFMCDPNDSIVYSYEVFECNQFPVQIDPSYFTPGQAVTLYPMLRFRHPGEQWQIIPPMEQNLTAGCDEQGRFFMISNVKENDKELKDIAVTKGTGRLGERNDVTVRIRNNGESDYINSLYITPLYLGHITPEEYGTAPVLAEGKRMECGAYIPAKGEADVTFSYVPERGGTVVFLVFDKNNEIGEMPLVLNNDTLSNYDAYIENKSYMSRDGDQWYWNVELADRIGAKMPHWIPSDSLYLHIAYMVNNEMVQRLMLKEELHEYLLALPDSIGSGEYTFRYQLPIDLSQPGDYYLDSYFAYVVNDERLGVSCGQKQRFTIDDRNSTSIAETVNGKSSNNKWFDLNGRRLSGKPAAKGVYVVNGRKVAVYSPTD